MDYFRQDSAHISNSFAVDAPADRTVEDSITRRLWVRRVLTFCSCLFLVGTVAFGVYRSVGASSDIAQHASLRADVRSTH